MTYSSFQLKQGTATRRKGGFWRATIWFESKSDSKRTPTYVLAPTCTLALRKITYPYPTAALSGKPYLLSTEKEQ